MALSTYTELQAAVLDWMVRASQTGKVADWITLAEARLNRELGAVETNVSLTGTLDSRSIDVTAHAVERPIALWLAEAGMDEVPVTPKTEGTFAVRSTSGRPAQWGMDGSNVVFDCPLGAAYPFRFRIRQRFALATSPTNWLLTNHPDVYLAAAIVWGSAYNKNLPEASSWKQLLDEAIPSIKSTIAQSKRAVLTVDPALASRGGGMSMNEWTAG